MAAIGNILDPNIILQNRAPDIGKGFEDYERLKQLQMQTTDMQQGAQEKELIKRAAVIGPSGELDVAGTAANLAKVNPMIAYKWQQENRLSTAQIAKERAQEMELKRKVLNDLQKDHSTEAAALVTSYKEKISAATTPEQKAAVEEEFAPQWGTLGTKVDASMARYSDMYGVAPSNVPFNKQHAEILAFGNPDYAKSKLPSSEKSDWEIKEVTLPDGTVKSISHNKRTDEIRDTGYLGKQKDTPFTKKISEGSADRYQDLQIKSESAKNNIPQVWNAIGVSNNLGYWEQGKFVGRISPIFSENAERANKMLEGLSMNKLIEQAGGKSSMFNSNMEKESFNITQANLRDRPITRNTLLVGNVIGSERLAAEAEAQREYLQSHPDLKGYTSPLEGKVPVVNVSTRSVTFIAPSEFKNYQKQGYENPSWVVDSLSGKTLSPSAGTNEKTSKMGVVSLSKSASGKVGPQVGGTFRGKRITVVNQDGSFETE